MSYYPDDDHPGPATLALVDAVTGQEIGDVNLAGVPDPFGGSTGTGPSHAGGVSVQGDSVIVVDKGKVYTYSMSDIRRQQSGASVSATDVQTVPAGGSYSAIKDGRLYLGDYAADTLYVYEQDASGSWQPARDASGSAEVIDTPDKAQGVVVRDGEFVFSTSPNRFDEGSLIVQGRDTGERSDPYTLPHMSEGVVEVDGTLVTTYESTAEQYDDDGSTYGWVPGVPRLRRPLGQPVPHQHAALRARTERATSTSSPGRCARPRTRSTAQPRSSRPRRRRCAGVDVSAAVSGTVPAPATLADAVRTLLGRGPASLRSGSKAVGLAPTA